jgi:cell division protein DivIC
VSKRLPRVSAAKIILGVTALAVVYFLVAVGFNAIRSHQLRQQEGQLQSEIEQIQGRYQRLEALKGYLNSDEYIETVAREQMGLVREGETGFVAIPTGPTPTPAPGDQGPGLWWDTLIR